MKLRLGSWLTALALAVAGLSLAAGPATAAGGYCTASGVNVVVDFGALGGGVQKGCGSGSVASDAFQSAGFPLTTLHTGGMNGFVCTVSGKPGAGQGGCSGAGGDGYWALFVANSSGGWTYANLGPYSQPVSSGQSVAFAWQAPGSSQRAPATTPASAIAKPTPTPTKTHVAPKPTMQPTPSPSASLAAAAKPSASPTAKHHKHPHATVTQTPNAMPTASATPAESMGSVAATTHPAKSNSGLPWWIPVGVVVVLVVGAGGAWWRKRARG